jgi:hypothetical protein
MQMVRSRLLWVLSFPKWRITIRTPFFLWLFPLTVVVARTPRWFDRFAWAPSLNTSLMHLTSVRTVLGWKDSTFVELLQAIHCAVKGIAIPDEILANFPLKTWQLSELSWLTCQTMTSECCCLRILFMHGLNFVFPEDAELDKYKTLLSVNVLFNPVHLQNPI